MASRKQPSEPESRNLSAEDLLVGIQKLRRRIEELSRFDVSSIEVRFDTKCTALQDKINSTLADIFGRGTPEYRVYAIDSLDTLPLTMGGRSYHVSEIQTAYRKGINNAVTRLNSLIETLEEKIEYIPKEHDRPKGIFTDRDLPHNRHIFIVHGHDDLAKQTVARFLAELDLTPIILHEQPNMGRTIIEKLEAYTSVDFAVVLLTPDDIGYPANDETKKSSRARQNVILELGLFIGVLGRARVCALYKGGVEIPTDYHGVLFTPMDDAGAWRLALAREIKQAGVDVDMNKAL